MDISDFGYWSLPFTVYGDDKAVISYSVPRILSDGTVYGVLGIDITLDYLKKIIPYSEIYEDKKGSYILAVYNENTDIYETVLINGPLYQQNTGNNDFTDLRKLNEDLFEINSDSGKFICSAKSFNLYNTNTKFVSLKWTLIGLSLIHIYVE